MKKGATPASEEGDRQPVLEDGMELLSIPECRHALNSGGVGILALCGVVSPVLRPVNFAIHEDWVMIRTGAGQILEAACTGEPASFVFSQTDALEHEGFSVIVEGRLIEHSAMVGVPYLPLRPWARAEKNRFVGLSMDKISGRRIGTVGALE